MIVLCPDNYSKGATIMTKHLNFDNRLDIERYLREDFSISEISRILSRHKSTISREITLRSAISKRVVTAVITMRVSIGMIVL